MRNEFSKQTKRAAMERSGGACENCTRKLTVGDYHYDHIIADGLGGDTTLGNCAVLCKSCHSIKTTTQDAPTIAKCKRVSDRYRGIAARPRRRLGWRKFDGTPVRGK